MTLCEFCSSTFWLRKHKLTASCVCARLHLLFIIMVTRLPRSLLYIIHFCNKTCHPWVRQWKTNCFRASSLMDNNNNYDKNTGRTDKNKASIYCQRESAPWLTDIINILKIQTMCCDDDLQAWFTFLAVGAAQNRLKLHVCDIHCVSRVGQGGSEQRGCGEKTANSALRQTADWHSLAWGNYTENVSCSYLSSRGNQSNPEERKVVDENWMTTIPLIYNEAHLLTAVRLK